jgi:hypothetical protein
MLLLLLLLLLADKHRTTPRLGSYSMPWIPVLNGLRKLDIQTEVSELIF